MQTQTLYYLLAKISTPIFCALLGSANLAYATDSITVYSARSEHLIKPFFEQYTAKTGIKINYLTDKDAVLINRIASEGKNTPADVLVTVDAGNLWHAAQKGLLSSVDSKQLNNNVPAQLIGSNNQWFALTVRLRTIIYNKDKVKPSELSTYAQLADRKWQGRLCLRTSKKIYNQSLVAMMIATHGEAKSESIVKGWVSNLAIAPLAKDSQVITAVERGRCDIGLVNTYYVGRAIAKDPSLANKVGVFFADTNGLGTHVNVSGAGVLKHSKNKQAATALIEWLSSKQVQMQFAAINHEYPVNRTAEISPILKAWGPYKGDDRPVYLSGALQTRAVKLMDRAGYR